MSQKIEFVQRASKAGANVSELCREYGVSRETGHKWLRRFRAQGYDGLEEESRRPKNAPTATGIELVTAVLEAREAHPSWGPKKLELVLKRKYGAQTPSRATIARLLDRFGKAKRRKHRHAISIVEQRPNVVVEAPNELWTVDFKGWWRAQDGSRCEPLTVRDAYSRFVLRARAMPSPQMALVRKEFEALFRKVGLPKAIQCDNGTPFICTRARGGLTRLSAWWISLGIRVVRSRPGCPQDNGAHERMHRDISEEVEAFAGHTRRREQRALDRWRQEFNHVRPHEAIGGKTPAELYAPSARRGLLPARYAYPRGWLVRRVNLNGEVSIGGTGYIVSKAVKGHRVGMEPLAGLRHRVWFHTCDLGEIEVTPSVVDVAQMLAEKPPSGQGKAWTGPPKSPISRTNASDVIKTKHRAAEAKKRGERSTR